MLDLFQSSERKLQMQLKRQMKGRRKFKFKKIIVFSMFAFGSYFLYSNMQAKSPLSKIDNNVYLDESDVNDFVSVEPVVVSERQKHIVVSIQQAEEKIKVQKSGGTSSGFSSEEGENKSTALDFDLQNLERLQSDYLEELNFIR